MIFCGYQGIGKSTLAGQGRFIDLESGNFWIERDDKTVARPGGWEKIYVNMADHLSKQGFDVFMSSHKSVRDILNERGIAFYTIYPSLDLQIPWIKKLEDRYLASNLDKDFKALKNAECMYAENIKDLASEEYHIEITDINYSLEELIKETKA